VIPYPSYQPLPAYADAVFSKPLSPPPQPTGSTVYVRSERIMKMTREEGRREVAFERREKRREEKREEKRREEKRRD
jgi:hypothetical protein